MSQNATCHHDSTSAMNRISQRPLPAAAVREQFLTLLASHRGMIVTGETGCGKTTQIPQFIFEQQPDAKVLVCQPRRLAAVGE